MPHNKFHFLSSLTKSALQQPLFWPILLFNKIKSHQAQIYLRQHPVYTLNCYFCPLLICRLLLQWSMFNPCLYSEQHVTVTAQLFYWLNVMQLQKSAWVKQLGLAGLAQITLPCLQQQRKYWKMEESNKKSVFLSFPQLLCENIEFVLKRSNVFLKYVFEQRMN